MTTLVPSVSSGQVLYAADYNAYVKDNINELAAWKAGTLAGSTQEYPFDTNDAWSYDRSTNTLRLVVAGTVVFAIAADGRFTTPSSFESAETTITDGSTATIAHGLGGQPRWVMGVYGIASGPTNRPRVMPTSYISLGSNCRIEQVGASNILVTNNTGVTVYVVVFALR